MFCSAEIFKPSVIFALTAADKHFGAEMIMYNLEV